MRKVSSCSKHISYIYMQPLSKLNVKFEDIMSIILVIPAFATKVFYKTAMNCCHRYNKERGDDSIGMIDGNNVTNDCGEGCIIENVSNNITSRRAGLSAAHQMLWACFPLATFPVFPPHQQLLCSWLNAPVIPKQVKGPQQLLVLLRKLLLLLLLLLLLFYIYIFLMFSHLSVPRVLFSFSTLPSFLL